MPELTKEQKDDLKNWFKKRKICFMIFVIWAFGVMPVVRMKLLLDAYSRASFPFDPFYYDYNLDYYLGAGVLIMVLIALFIDIRYRKKCPNCNSKIGEYYLLFSLPEKCNKCGIKFK